jgi:tetratricopeptide (TPR) repeat protein
MADKSYKNQWLALGSLTLIGGGVAAGALSLTAGGAMAAVPLIELLEQGAAAGRSILTKKFLDWYDKEGKGEPHQQSQESINVTGEALRRFFSDRLKEKFDRVEAHEQLDQLAEAAPKVWERIADEGFSEYQAAEGGNLPLLLAAATNGEEIFSEDAWADLVDDIIAEAKLASCSYRDQIHQYVVEELPKYFIDELKAVLADSNKATQSAFQQFQVNASQEILSQQQTVLVALQEIQHNQQITDERLQLEFGITRERLGKGINDLQKSIENINSKLDLLLTDIAELKEKANQSLKNQTEIKEEVESLKVFIAQNIGNAAELSKKFRIAQRAVETFFDDLGETNVSLEDWPKKFNEFKERYRDLEHQLAVLSTSTDEAKELRLKAQRAHKEGDLELAETLLKRIKDIDYALIKHETKRLEDRKLKAAKTCETLAEYALLRFEYRKAADLLGEAIQLVKSFDTTAANEWGFQQIDALRKQGDEKGDNGALEEVIEYYREKLTQTKREDDPDGWARLKRSLGTALSTLGERESGTMKLKKAADVYYDALLEHTREHSPLQWATLQNNLGIVLKRIGERDKDNHKLYDSIGAFLNALSVRDPQRTPKEWARTHNNLGNTYKKLGERENNAELLFKAVKSYEHALVERKRDEDPLDWAATKNNLGTALITLGEKENSTGHLKEAIRIFEEALGERSRDRVPFHWAMTKNNLGIAQSNLGERYDNIDLLYQSINSYKDAHKEWTKSKLPLQWALVHSNLSNVLTNLGERVEKEEILRQALNSCEKALEVRTRELFPLDWATTQNNSANSLTKIGILCKSKEMLFKAINAFHMALEVRKREVVPFQWARTQNNLGVALFNLGDLERNNELFYEAITCLKKALNIRTFSEFPYSWARTQKNLGDTYFAKGLLNSLPRELELARVTYIKALSIFEVSDAAYFKRVTKNQIENLDKILRKP